MVRKDQASSKIQCCYDFNTGLSSSKHSDTQNNWLDVFGPSHLVAHLRFCGSEESRARPLGSQSQSLGEAEAEGIVEWYVSERK